MPNGSGLVCLQADKAAQETKAISDTPISVNPPGISSQPTIPGRRPPSLGEVWTDETSLGAAPLLPSHDGQLLSDWPAMAIPPEKAPQLIDSAFMATVTGKDFVGYAPNPGFKRGQSYKGLVWLKRGDTSQLPGDEKGSEMGVEGTTATEKAFRKAGKWAVIDSDYKLQEIKLGKLGIEDFPFHKYNQTQIGGLENTIPNSYANAWLSTMLFNIPLRTRVLNYLSAKEVCLTDELGFLFHMLVSSRGQCCQATNFLRAFSQLPEASRLELLDKTTATAFVPREVRSRVMVGST